MVTAQGNGRLVKIKPTQMGISSGGFIIPRWSLQLNGSPEYLELNISLDELAIRPPKEGDYEA